LETMTPGLLYTITVGQGEAGIHQVCGNTYQTTPGAQISFHAWTFIPCLLTFEAFNTTSGTAISELTSSPNYPNNPRETKFISGFNSRLGYPDDSHEFYGGRMWGYIVPPYTGDFVFYLSSDDAGRLNMNTNSVNSEDPAGAVMILEETACCHAFGDLGTPVTKTVSPVVHLNMGQHYYVEGLWKEGGGGDYLQIAAAPPGLTPAQANALSPIGPEFLGTIANPDAVPVLPVAGSRPLGSMTDRGFDLHLVQVTTNIDNLLSIAELLLAGGGGPNVALAPYFYETSNINYSVEVSSYGSIPNDRPFPGIPGLSNSTDNIVMEALTYVELAQGYHCMIVNSDDGFRLTPATCVGDPNNALVLGSFDGGRGATDSPFLFYVPAAGLYPMRLIWEQGGGGANVEWVDIQPANVLVTGSARVAVNGNNNIKAFAPGMNRLSIARVGNNVVVSWGANGLCAGYRLQGATALANPSSATVWNNIAGSSPVTVSPGAYNFFRLISP